MKKLGYNKVQAEKDYVLGLIYDINAKDSNGIRQNRIDLLNKKSRTIDSLIKEEVIGLSDDYEIIDPGAAKHIFKIKNQEYYQEMLDHLHNIPELISVFKEFMKHYSLGNIDRRHQLSYILFAHFFERELAVKDYTVYKHFNDYFENIFTEESHLKVAHPNSVLKQKYIKHPYSLDLSRCDYDFDLNNLNKVQSMNSTSAIEHSIATLKKERERLLKLHRDEPRHLMLIGDNNQGILRLNSEGLMVSMNNNPVKKLFK